MHDVLASGAGDLRKLHYSHSDSLVAPMPDTSHTDIIRYRAGGLDLASYLAYDPSRSGKRPGLIVLPEWWGLND
ncbi:MAG: hypothetical protein EBZ91_14720, partial [Gammaproteobacteria bacterium]|nr:hypothetical protein [Gammaproteobacteria bacterium]